MTSKTKSERFRRLLSHGYFAPELPPCFVSDDLAKYRRSILDKINALPFIRNAPASQRFLSEPSWFYFPRYGKDDRRHGVPNPIAYLLLTNVVAENYVKLKKAAKKSGISASPPIFDWSGPRALMRPNVDLRDDFRVDLSSRREEFVAADIRAFFHSIYTHAIPWAIYGKSWAKANRGLAHYGNLIDLFCRNSQDGQTIGLPVGPDTSRLIAEVIASAVDEQLRQIISVNGADASRYVDDYTISSAVGHSGESLLAALRQAAARFELELNNEKSAVYLTSARQNSGWKQAVRSYLPQGVPDYGSIQRFFYEVARICEAHPDLNVEKYALQNARSTLLRTTEWRKVQSNLINFYRRNPSLISFLVEMTILRETEHHDVDRNVIRDFIHHRLPVLAQSNRTGEIIWLLFLAIRLNITLSASALKKLLEIEVSMIALLVTFAVSRDLITEPLNLQYWNRALNSDGLRGPMWLHAYETVGQGFNPNGNSMFIEQDPFFSVLHAKKVRFFDIHRGFTSIAATLRSLRGDNSRMRRLRDDFFEDFTLELDEFDDDDGEEFAVIDDGGY